MDSDIVILHTEAKEERHFFRNTLNSIKSGNAFPRSVLDSLTSLEILVVGAREKGSPILYANKDDIAER